MSGSMTSKGQVTVPKSIRERLQLKAGDRVQFFLDEDGTVRMTPVTRSIKDLKGALPSPCEARTLEEMEDDIRRGALGQL